MSGRPCRILRLINSNYNEFLAYSPCLLFLMSFAIACCFCFEVVSLECETERFCQRSLSVSMSEMEVAVCVTA